MTIEKMLDDIYRIEVPLPESPLRSLNAYLIRGTHRHLLIDAGFNRSECRDAIHEALSRLGTSMDDTDLFFTHVHSDHTGLAGALQRQTTTIYTGNYTARSFTEDRMIFWELYPEIISQSGLPPIDVTHHPGYTYMSDPLPYPEKLKVVSNGMSLSIGRYTFRCIETPGHAPDHICLYDDEKALLFAGDHILGTITPNNTIWSPPWGIKEDALGDYFRSLDIIEQLPVELTLVAHRFPIVDVKPRIEGLRQHHRRRLDSVLTILDSAPEKGMNGAEVAARMQWDLSEKRWDHFPVTQKIFAAGEAVAHLVHLLFEGLLETELIDGVVYYRKK